MVSKDLFEVVSNLVLVSKLFSMCEVVVSRLLFSIPIPELAFSIEAYMELDLFSIPIP